MSADGFLATSETELISTVLAALRGDAGLIGLLGDPPRVFDGETTAAILPYVEMERVETRETSASGAKSLEHQIQFAVASKHGGLEEAKAIMGALRQAFEAMRLATITQRVVLIMPTYSDIMRSKKTHAYRGVFRVRIHTEET